MKGELGEFFAVYCISFILLGFLQIEGTELFADTTDFLLCRHCGINVAAGTTVVNIKSPSAIAVENQTLFGLDTVLVQTLRNPLGLTFDVVTAQGGTCIASVDSKWENLHSWYPGHVWKPCQCSRCLKHIGWIFEPLQTATDVRVYASSHGFYVYNLDSIIGEAYSDSLVASPKLSTHH